MDEQEKPFGIVSIVFLIMIGLTNDLLEVMFDLFAATVIGLSGQALMEPINLLVDALITGWFFAKLGFGGPTFIQLVDDIAELVGVPARTLCLALGIWLANNPSSTVGRLATAATMVESGGLEEGAYIGGEIEGRQIAVHTGMNNEELGDLMGDEWMEEKGLSRSEGKKATKGRPSEAVTPESDTQQGQQPDTDEDTAQKEEEEALQRELGGEVQENPMEVEQRHLFEGPTMGNAKSDDSEEEEVPPKPPAGTRNNDPKVQDISAGRGRNLRDYEDEENRENFDRKEAA